MGGGRYSINGDAAINNGVIVYHGGVVNDGGLLVNIIDPGDGEGMTAYVAVAKVS